MQFLRNFSITSTALFLMRNSCLTNVISPYTEFFKNMYVVSGTACTLSSGCTHIPPTLSCLESYLEVIFIKSSQDCCYVAATALRCFKVRPFKKVYFEELYLLGYNAV
jgi:hypothetical protein